MSETIIKGHVGIGPTVEGIALSASDNFSTRYDLDRDQGLVSRPSHKLYGENYVGRILVLNAAKGGVASAWMLREMVQKNKDFCIVDEVDSILIDESRTPLIISGGIEDKSDQYFLANKFIKALDKKDFELDEKNKNAILKKQKKTQAIKSN